MYGDNKMTMGQYGGSQPAKQQQQGGGTQALASAGMMSGNPYLMGASMGLQALSAASAAKKQEFNAKRAEQSKAFDAFTRAINTMA